ncbi:MAG: Bug family tripartite tricarboxylate transporter substrate binding protein [Burkholderiales bacterium]
MKTASRACAFAACALTACLIAASTAACAQDYPIKPVRLVVASTPGGGTDISARLIAPKLTEYLGRQFVVENRPGATTTIGVDFVAKSPPDGYTLLMGVSSLAINPHILKNVPYDALKDLAPISQVLVSPNIMVAHPSLPARSVKELIAFARPRPGELNFAAGGAGSNQHLAIELFLYMTGVKIVHVPYKGQGMALLDTVAGQVSLMMANVISALPHVRNARLRALGVTGAKRATVAPDIPTIAEAGVPGYEVLQWYGVLAPAATPREIIGRLHDAVARAVQDPKIRERIVADAGEPVGNTPDELAAILRADFRKWGEVIRKAGIKVDQR